MGRPRKRKKDGLDIGDDVVHEISSVQDVDTLHSALGSAPSAAGAVQAPILSPGSSESFGMTLPSIFGDYNHITRPEGLFPTTNLTTNPLITSSATDSTCACVTHFNLAWWELQRLKQFDFPQALAPIRSATITASNMVRCEVCPREKGTARRNLSDLVTLLHEIVEKYKHLLDFIDSEYHRISAAGEQKPFQMGDNRPENAHLHSGTLDCPMRFEITLDPPEWHKLVLKVIKAMIIGPHCSGESLLQLVDKLADRQKAWHKDPAHPVNDLALSHEDLTCAKLIGQIRGSIMALRL